jgi:exosortase/archaeosortase family protein
MILNMGNEKLLRTSAEAQFGKKTSSKFKSMMQKMLIGLVFIFISLPLFTTFNEILTKVAEKSGFYNYLAKNIVPFEARAVTLVLIPLGVKVKPSDKYLYIQNNKGQLTPIYLSWNCLGWQSVILLGLTLFAGLTGNYSMNKKTETIILGLSGTFLINIIRISVVVLIAYYFGQLPATIVHDYGGTLFTVSWFFFYWWFSYKFILGEK